MGRQWRRMLGATAAVLVVPIGLDRLPAAYAYSCVPNQTIDDETARADVIFDGTATERTATQPPSFEPATGTGSSISSAASAASATPLRSPPTS